MYNIVFVLCTNQHILEVAGGIIKHKYNAFLICQISYNFNLTLRISIVTLDHVLAIFRFVVK